MGTSGGEQIPATDVMITVSASILNILARAACNIRKDKPPVIKISATMVVLSAEFPGNEKY